MKHVPVEAKSVSFVKTAYYHKQAQAEANN